MVYNDGLRYYLESQKSWVKSFLSDILSIPSESGKEGSVQKSIYNILKTFDVSCELIKINNDIIKDPEYSDIIKNLNYAGRPNLKAEKPGSGGKTIIINSHVDTVPPSALQKNPYLPFIDSNNNIFARGACDAKGQIAVMALLLKAACEYKQFNHNIVCHMVIEEEIGGNGSLAMIKHEKNIKADALINMEPTNLRIMTSMRGAVWFEMNFSGKSAHSGSTSNSPNVIYKAIRAIEILKEYHYRLYNESKNYGLFSGMDNPMPLTVGQFISGVWPSMVPNESVIRGVIGFLPNRTREEVIQGLINEFDKPENIWIREGMQLSFNYRHNATELPVSHWFAQGMSEACLKCNIHPVPTAMTASTDAVFYQEMLGIPVLAFGPGDIKFAHSADEHINLNDIIKGAEVILSFCDVAYNKE